MAEPSSAPSRARVIVRTAQHHDIPELAHIDVRAWRAAYSSIFPEGAVTGLSAPRRMFKWARVLSRRRDSELVLVAEIDGRIVGFCQAGADRDDPEAAGEIYTLYVDPDAWGRGVGSALIEIALTWLAPRYERAILWVVRENEPARRFYEACGFEWDEDSFRIFPFFDFFAQCVRYSTNLNAHLSYDWQRMY